jgi:hypothetical protein
MGEEQEAGADHHELSATCMGQRHFGILFSGLVRADPFGRFQLALRLNIVDGGA